MCVFGMQATWSHGGFDRFIATVGAIGAVARGTRTVAHTLREFPTNRALLGGSTVLVDHLHGPWALRDDPAVAFARSGVRLRRLVALGGAIERGTRTVLSKVVGMRSVRCDACGAKAMTAAAKCPKCSHLLDLRDGFGELLPLAYCSSCDSYYPEHLGECKWCHTKPERPPIGPKIWRAVGAGLAAVLGGVWLVGNLTSDAKPQRAKTGTQSVARKAASDSITDSVKQAAPTAVVASANEDSLTPVVSPSPSASAPVVLPQAVVQPVGPPVAPAVSAPIAAAPRIMKSNGTVVPAARRSSSPWVRSVSRDWVIIRRDASKRSKVVASIGPNSRVELGESRGTWRRLRAKGVAGWVEPRNLFEVARAR